MRGSGASPRRSAADCCSGPKPSSRRSRLPTADLLSSTPGRYADLDPAWQDAAVAHFLHTMVRITDPARSRAFYEALGFRFSDELDLVRNGELEATNYFFSIGDQERVLELTYNHDGRTYELGTGYGHAAVGVDDLDEALARLKKQGIEPEREPYRVREGGSRLCFVRDPDRKLTIVN